MRIVIDMQGAQTASRFRGIGRYTLGFAQAVVRNRGEHEVILMLSNLFADTVQPIRDCFRGLLPAGNILLWHGVGPVASGHEGNETCRHVAELSRECFLESLQPDVVHVCSLFEGYGDDAVTSVGRMARHHHVSVTLHDLIPLVNRTHYLDCNERYRTYYFDKLAQLKEADCLLAVSQFSLAEGRDLLSVPPDRLHCTYEAIEARFSPWPVQTETSFEVTQARLGIDREYLLYTGGADERKNLTQLLMAFAMLPKRLRDRYQLVFAGKIAPEEMGSLGATIKATRLAESSVVFTGYIPDDDLIALYQRCALFVFPSWHEGFGLPALEAMSCGAPVICSNTSSLPEVVGNSEALFDPHDAASISAKIVQVLEDEALRRMLVASGLRQAERFNWDDCAKAAIRAWEGTVARAGRPGSHSAVTPLRLIDQLLIEGASVDDPVSLALAESNNHRNGRARFHYCEVASAVEDRGVSASGDALGADWLPVRWTHGRFVLAGASGSEWPCHEREPVWRPGDVLLTRPDGSAQHAEAAQYLAGLRRLGVVVSERTQTNGDGAEGPALCSLADGLLDEPAPRQLLVDVSELIKHDARTGIQRVVRNILREWLKDPPAGYLVAPVYATAQEPYRYARRYAREFVGAQPTDALADDVIECAAGDIFFGLDLQPEVVPAHAATYSAMRAQGVKVVFMVYDLLPVTMPQYFGEGADVNHARWLTAVAKGDGAICISRTVSDELTDWMGGQGIANPHFQNTWVHLGADLDQDKGGGELIGDEAALVQTIQAAPSLLMVGTLEPRKGHQQVLEACEVLWAQGQEFNLVIVGKAGWKTEQLTERLAAHPLRGLRLFWMSSASDALLQALYQRASALLAASYGEGYGLPLIEAAQRGVPVIARDIPVFREVGQSGAYYFQEEDAPGLAATLQAWDALRAKGAAPSSAHVPVQTWRDSAFSIARQLTAGDL